jgi:hypothetical protein
VHTAADAHSGGTRRPSQWPTGHTAYAQVHTADSLECEAEVPSTVHTAAGANGGDTRQAHTVDPFGHQMGMLSIAHTAYSLVCEAEMPSTLHTAAGANGGDSAQGGLAGVHDINAEADGGQCTRRTRWGARWRC